MAKANLSLEKQMQFHIELMINEQLYKEAIIDKATYETISNDILRIIQKGEK